MYSLLLESYIKDPQEKHRLFHAIDTFPAIKKKADWAIKWISRCVQEAGVWRRVKWLLTAFFLPAAAVRSPSASWALRVSRASSSAAGERFPSQL